MNKYKKTVKQMVIGFASCVARKVTANDSDWPPVCMGLFYQPKRPMRNGNYEQNKDNISIQKRAYR